MKISLLVLRCHNIETSKHFYQLLGLSFTKEKHGNGPDHYSCECDGCIFELYSNNRDVPLDNNRLGFKVSSLADILQNVTPSDTYEHLGETIYIVTDPDGRKVEISA